MKSLLLSHPILVPLAAIGLAAQAPAQFADPVETLAPWVARTAAFGDLNADGNVDALVPLGAEIRVYFGDGRGGFELSGFFSSPGTTSIDGMLIQDLDGDGDLDVLATAARETFCSDGTSTCYRSRVRRFLNDGSGHAVASGSTAEVDGFLYHPQLSVTASGITLFVAQWSPFSQVLAYEDVTFTGEAPDGITAVPYARNPFHMEDLDGDGYQDIVLIDEDDSTSAPDRFEIVWQRNLGGSVSFAAPVVLNRGQLMRSLTTVDLDADGASEIVFGRSGQLFSMPNLGGGAFAPPQAIANSPLSPTRVDFVDMNGDGHGDLLATYFGRIDWYQGLGGGAFAPSQAVTGTLSSELQIDIIDGDQDGDLDVFALGDLLTPSGPAPLFSIDNLALPIPSDACATATPLLPNLKARFETSGASTSGPSWSCATGGGDSWFSFTVPDDWTSFRVQLDSTFDAAVEIFDGTCSALQSVACDTATGPVEVLLDQANPGQTYVIRVGRGTSADGEGTICVLAPRELPGECLANGDFDSGDLAGWSFQDIAGAYLPLEVIGADVTPGFGLFATNPTSGDFAFHTGFDGAGPGTIRLSRTLSVEPYSSELTFSYRAGWTILNPTAVLDRTFSVVVRDATSGAVLQSQLVLTAAAQTTNFDGGPQLGLVDLSPYIGQDVELSFEWFVPEDNTGPAHVQIDSVTCTRSAGPSIHTTFCPTHPNSTGDRARLFVTGSTSVDHNRLTLHASALPTNTFGLFITSRASSIFAGNIGSTDGILCLGGNIGRFNVVRSSGASGQFSYAVDIAALPQGSGTMAAVHGSRWHFQGWFRDTVGLGSNLTRGVFVRFD